jgi:dTDP-4-dehydrorhamnose reductase
MVVLVTGANGQLGQSLQFIAPNYPEIYFVFCSSADLDISNLENCQSVFFKIKPNYCINAAAYTAVDKAESELEKANLINVIGAQNLAVACKQYSTILLHISTDFVFDGNSTKPYTENDIPNPSGVYGQTKLDGEKVIQDTFENYYIIRTSWVYSQFGNNFMKTMLRLASERDSLSVVNDQIGSPTNAIDLAEALIKIITSSFQFPASSFGIYNFSNEGQCSWYNFAKKIFEVNNIYINLLPISTLDYPTPAQRPKFSVLDKSKIIKVFGLVISDWQMSLKK